MLNKQPSSIIVLVSALIIMSLSSCAKAEPENIDIKPMTVESVEPELKPAADPEADKQAINEIIESVRLGWLNADGTSFRKHFLDFEGARYFETGGQNIGLNDLVVHHVEPEGDAFTEFELNFTNIQTHLEGDFAWALVDVKLNATLKRDGRVLDNKGHETFIFKRIDGEWKVLHTHSSSRPVKK